MAPGQPAAHDLSASPKAKLIPLQHELLLGPAAARGHNLPELGNGDARRQPAPGTLTPDGLAAALERARGLGTRGAAADAGAMLAQRALDSGLRQLESRLSKRLFRTVNLSWSPGFNGREDVYQLDGIASLHDGRRGSLMSQLGLQRRDGETGANLGMVLRGKGPGQWTYGLNAFYDYLAEPQVDRWSVGAEMLGRWFSVSGNVYTGLDEDTRGGNVHYSPDGWDIEFAGRAPRLPWLELAGRRYHWKRVGQAALKGEDYRLTLSPVPLLGVSLRYDDASEGGGSDFGFEASLSYEIGRPASEQLRPREAGAGVDPWQRRFERVRREYEQRVQRRAAAGVTAIGGAAGSTTACIGSSCAVTLRVGSMPSGTAAVVVTASRGSSPSLGASGLLRAAGPRSAGCCIVVGITGASCDFDGAGAVTVNIGNAASGSYSFRIGFQDTVGTELGSASVVVPLTVTDPRGVTSTAPALSVDEGGSASYGLSLSSEPTAAVTVTLASANSDLSLSPGTLSFTTGNWNTAQTVTVAAAEDSDSSNEFASISYSFSGSSNYSGFTPAPQRLVINDNDGPGVSSSAAPTLALNEGGTPASYTLALRTQPTAAVTVSIGSSDVGAVTVSPSSLSFTPGNWSAAQTVMVTAVADDDASDETASIRYFVSGGDYADVAPPAQEVTVDDDEAVGVTSTGGASLVVMEGMQASYTLALDTRPSATVTISIGSSDAGAVTVSPPSLSFSASNWDTPQTVTVAGMEDADTAVETASIGYVVSGGDYEGLSLAAQSVTVMDNDIPGLTSSQSGAVAVTEGGAVATYTLVLNVQPSAAVTVAISSDDPDAATVTGSLVFTTGNWDTAQTVTVTAVDDADAAAETVTVSYVVSGGDYAGVSLAPQAVVVTDDDSPGVSSSQSGPVAVTEGGAAATYTLVLDTQPVGAVTVTMSSDDPNAVTVTRSLVFTEGNWDTAQVVTVTAVDDADAAAETVSISHMVSGGDYGGVSLAPQAVMVTDDDSIGINSTGGASLAVTEGRLASYTLVLASRPTSTVTVALASSDASVVTVSPASLSFASGNWDTAQAVTVTGTEDVDTAAETASISYVVSGGDYEGFSLAAQAVAVTDDDMPGVTSSQSGAVEVTEGMAATYDLVLDTPPAAAVTVTMSSDDPAAATVTGSLVFTVGNWDTPQTVTVTAVDDDDAAAETVRISYVISGGDYGAVSLAPQIVTVTDDDPRGLTSSQSGAVELTEGGAAATYTLVLDTLPSAAVTVIMSSDDPAAATVTGSLSFTTGNWDTAQTVTVTAVDDPDATTETVRISYVISGGDYGAVSLAPQLVTVTDDDPRGVTSSQSSPVELTEGGAAATYTLVLDTQPVGAVTVAMSSDDPDAATVTGSLVFTAGNWSMPQTVTVTAVDDADASDESVSISYVISGGDYDGVSLAAQGVMVDDNDSIGVTSTGGASLAVTEGRMSAYTLVLTSRPAAVVTVALTSSDVDVVTVSPASLSFTGNDWDTAQAVTVTGTEDADTAAETASISYVVSGGDYDGFSLAAQAVAVTDNDVPGLTSTGGSVLAVTEGGSAARYDLVLNTQPSATVTVALGSSDTGIVTVSPSSLEFSSENWDTAQAVMVRAVDDPDASDESASISYGISGGDYAGVSLSAQNVMVEDDDSLGVTSTGGASVAVTEGGASATYTLVLDTQPSAMVTMALASSDMTAVTATESLSFSAGNWDTPQMVTVTAVADADAVSETVSVSYTLSGGDYEGFILAAQAVAVTDNDTPGLTSTGGSVLTVSEGGSAVQYDLVLDTQPSAAVTVALASGDAPAVAVTESLSFSAGNWDTPQTVTVVAVDDPDAMDESLSISYTLSGGDYDGLVLAAQAVAVTDDDTPGMSSTAGADLALDEGSATAQYGLALDTQPAAEVTVAIASGTPAVLTASPPSLTFTDSNWDTPQTVTLGSTANSVTADAAVSLSYALTSADGGYDGLSVAAQGVTVRNVTVPPVVGLEASVGSRHFVLSWTNPSHAGLANVRISVQRFTHTFGGVRRYRDVDINGAAPGSDLTIAAEPGAAGSRLVANLLNNSEHIVRVVALDGNSNQSAVATTTVIPRLIVEFTSAASTVAEGSSVSFGIAINVAPGTVWTSLAVYHNAWSFGGSAGAADYSLANAASTAFLVPVGATSPVMYEFSAVADDILEGNETLVITLNTSSSSGFRVGSQGTHTITITDATAGAGPVPMVTNFAALAGDGQAALSWTNPAHAGLANVRIGATIDGVAGAVDINGDELAGSDLILAAATGASGSHTVTGLSNGTEYTFSIVALDSSSVASAAAIATATPNPTLSFATASDSANEGARVTVRINISSPYASNPPSLSVSFGGTALRGSAMDYTTVNSGSATVGASSIMLTTFGASASFSIDVRSDGEAEDAETIEIRIAPGAGYTIGANPVYTLSVTDPASASSVP